MDIQKILLVDDDPTIHLLAQKGINTLEPKWQVVSASSGQEGIDKAIKEKPDIILLDMIMPGMDGKTTLSKLRQNNLTAAIPVIFLTAMMHRHEVDNYVDRGVLGVIAKPFDPLTLSVAMTQLSEIK